MSTDITARFGAIRELLQQPPDTQRWSELCARVEEALAACGEGAVVEVMLPYVVDSLRARWPAALCVAPLRWITDALTGRPSPCLPMARALLISRSSLSLMATSAGVTISPAAWWERILDTREFANKADTQRLTELLDRICALDGLDGVRHITLDCLRLDALNSERLALWPIWSRATSLTVQGGSVPLHELLAVETLRLEHLRVEHAGLSTASVKALTTNHAGLRTLVARRAALSPDALDTLWAADALPALEVLELSACTGVKRVLRGADRAGALPALRELELGDSPTTHNDLEALKGMGRLRALERLGLRRAGLDAAQLQALITALGDPNALRELDLSANPIGPEGARQLAAHPGFAPLERLELHECGLGNEGLTALAAGEHLRGLRALGLRDNDLSGNKAMGSFAQAFPALRELDLGGKNKLRPTGVTLLAEHPGLSRLGLARNSVKPEGALALANAPGSARLKELDLSGNRLCTDGVHALVSSPYLSDLRELILGTWMVRNDIGDDGAQLLAAWPALRTLEILSIYNDIISPVGAEALAASPYLRNLRILDLSDNRFGDAALAAFAASPVLQTVRVLLLERCNITPDGLATLTRSPHAKNLEIVSLRDNRLWGEEVYEAFLDQSLPNLQMIDLGDDVLWALEAPIHNLIPCGWLDGRRIRRWPMRHQSWWHEHFMG